MKSLQRFASLNIPRKNNSFTLIELLVVIAIIARSMHCTVMTITSGII